MKFLENLKYNIGGTSGGLGALGELLAAAAMGEANARPGEGTGVGAARGFAVGASGLGEAFARGRMKSDKESVRLMAHKKLQDPKLGPAERDLYTAIASGNSAALDLFDETLAARQSDRLYDAEQAKQKYYEGKLRGLTAPKAPSGPQQAEHREITTMRDWFIKHPEALAGIDRTNPDSDLARARQISPIPELDPFGEDFITWSGDDPLMTERPSFRDYIGQKRGEEGLALYDQMYRTSGSGGEPAPETGGAAANAGQEPGSGPAGDVIDSIAGTGGNWVDTLKLTIDNAFGTALSVKPIDKMGALYSEIEATGQDPRAAAPSPLVPEDQMDPLFNDITGGAGTGRGASSSWETPGPDLMGREDALRRSTGPTSRLEKVIGQIFPSGMPGEGGMMQNPSLAMRTMTDLETSIGAIPRQMQLAKADMRNVMNRFPGDFMAGIKSASGGKYGPATVDAFSSGEAARTGIARVFDPLRARFAPYSEMTPSLQQERQNFLKSLGWGG